jgi:hypothetical protein
LQTRIRFGGFCYTLLELLILVAITDRSRLSPLWNVAIDDKSGLGVAVALLLGAGGAGWLFSILHHTILWSRLLDPIYAIDFRPFINSSVRNNHVEIVDYDTWATAAAPKSPAEAWRMTAVLWHGGGTLSEKVADATQRGESLSDLQHGLGAGLVGALCAIAAWTFLHYSLWGGRRPQPSTMPPNG